MDADRTAAATMGDVLDAKDELRAEIQSAKDELRTEMVAMEERMTRSLAAEIGRVANVIMEHTTAQIRAAGDHPRAIEARLDAHVADVDVHRQPRRARRS